MITKLLNTVPPADTDILTKDELARRLKKCPRTIERWQARALIPYCKAGNNVFYSWQQVRRHLLKHFRVRRFPARGAINNKQTNTQNEEKEKGNTNDPTST